MLRVKYVLEIDDTIVIHFYNSYLWVGRYDYKLLEDDRRANDLFITINYRHEAIDYLKSVDLKIME